MDTKLNFLAKTSTQDVHPTWHIWSNTNPWFLRKKLSEMWGRPASSSSVVRFGSEQVGWALPHRLVTMHPPTRRLFFGVVDRQVDDCPPVSVPNWSPPAITLFTSPSKNSQISVADLDGIVVLEPSDCSSMLCQDTSPVLQDLWCFFSVESACTSSILECVLQVSWSRTIWVLPRRFPPACHVIPLNLLLLEMYSHFRTFGFWSGFSHWMGW